MSTGAYAFLLFGDSEHLVPGIETVRKMPAVLAWHAVDGHYHLALVLASADETVRAELGALPGVQDLLFCPVEREVINGFTADAEHCHAWLTMEIDAAKSTDLELQLQSIDGLEFGALAFGSCGCVAALSGDTFEQIDKVVDRHIRPLDGVLRVKRDWIIDLTQL
ncbi:MAG: hypothetical protein IH600_04425 [Bacteroidetes bacterium]|nr:hypothetical protein [Bacteroidota bacterium]